jgi:hypothetical protein
LDGVLKGRHPPNTLTKEDKKMKRILAILVCVSMILSMGVLMANAESEFNMVGDAPVTWIGEESSKIVFDGDISEWVDFDFDYTTIAKDNLVTWHVNDAPQFNVPEAIDDDFSINTYLAADSDYLYVAFFIRDDQFALSNNAAAYNGDAFQISVDWNRHMERALEDGMDYSNNKNVFYSFACMEEGAPLQMNVQEGFKDRVISEAASEDPDHPDMKGSAGSYEGGWCAEFCLSWELLYGDYEYKTWEETVDPFDADNPVTLGLQICYINRDETAGGILWAAGTFKDDEQFYDHTPIGNGMFAVLEWEEGRSLNCRGIGIPEGGGDDTDPVDSGEDTTDAVTTEAATTKAEEVTTKAGGGGATVVGGGSGCGSVVGTAGAAVLLSVIAAAAVIGKKKD